MVFQSVYQGFLDDDLFDWHYYWKKAMWLVLVGPLWRLIHCAQYHQEHAQLFIDLFAFSQPCPCLHGGQSSMSSLNIVCMVDRAACLVSLSPVSKTYLLSHTLLYWYLFLHIGLRRSFIALLVLVEHEEVSEIDWCAIKGESTWVVPTSLLPLYLTRQLI
jgi:hypothetical protein